MVDYKKLYEETFEKLQNIIYNHKKQGHIIVPIEDIENSFTELKEPENERIRKEIISFLKEGKPYYCPNSTKRQEWATWFETQLDYIQKHWKESDHYLRAKQGEPKSVNDTNEDIVKAVKDTSILDMTAPKFKVGDWILYSGDHYEGVRHITKIDENGYYIERNGLPHGIIPFNHEIFMRLWTIANAKDGEVLTEDSCIFIFKKLNHDHSAKIYCCLHDDGDFDITSALVFDDISTYPATKKQRNLLFQKMKEAGYEWDADNKKLKKIEDKPIIIDEGKDEIDRNFTEMMLKDHTKQKPAWSEEDSDMLDNIVAWIEGKWGTLGGKVGGKEAFISFLKSLKERYTWKPSDEQMEALGSAIHCYAGISPTNNREVYALEIMKEQLKKLKEE